MTSVVLTSAASDVGGFCEFQRTSDVFSDQEHRFGSLGITPKGCLLFIASTATVECD